jgi:hypothetical protein
MTVWWDSWPCNVSNIVYAVMLWACLVHCRYLAVTSKGWHGYSLSMSERATWHVTTVGSSCLLYIHDASGSSNKLGTPWCNARRIMFCHRHGMKVQILTPHSFSHLQRYGVTVHGALQVCTHPYTTIGTEKIVPLQCN